MSETVFTLNRPDLSPETKSAEVKITAAIQAAVDCIMNAKNEDAEELFDTVLFSAAMFFALAHPNQQERLLVVARFNDAIQKYGSFLSQTTRHVMQ